MVPTSKYVIWKSIWEGDYVRAEEVDDDGDTVSFLVQLQPVRQYAKKDILKYYKVEE